MKTIQILGIIFLESKLVINLLTIAIILLVLDLELRLHQIYLSNIQTLVF
jgi:hypothetical protein